jgi:hypothetical protein
LPESDEAAAAATSPEVCAAVLDALDDLRFDFRTVAGIAQETGLNPSDVRDALTDNRVRVSRAAGRNGELLYARRSRRVSFREAAAAMQQSVAA